MASPLGEESMSVNKKMLFLDALDPDTERQWLDYWRVHKQASWRQHPACGRLAAALGERVSYAVGILNDKIALIGAFSYRPIWTLGATEAICLRGPTFDDVSFARWCLPQISSHFRSRKIGLVRIGPYWRFPEAEELERTLFAMGYAPFEKGDPLGRRMTGIIDIRNSSDQVLKSFTKSTRYEIKHAEKLGIDLRTANGSREAMEFFSHLDKRDEARGITRASQKEHEATASSLAAFQETGVIINAYHKDTFLAGLLVVRGGRTAFTSKFVVSEDCKERFPSLRIAPSVFFKGMLWAKSQGCEMVDLEGYDPNQESSADRLFINRYKAGFSPVACQTLGQYYAVCNPAWYRVQRLLSFGHWAAQLPRRRIYKLRFALKKRLVLGKEAQG